MLRLSIDHEGIYSREDSVTFPSDPTISLILTV
jgi:hypothetical protein